MMNAEVKAKVANVQHKVQVGNLMTVFGIPFNIHVSIRHSAFRIACVR
jgi:hypothetical protein